MGTHRIASWGHGAALLGLVAGICALSGCKELPPQKLGQRCGGEYGGCAKGLRCSFKKKRCYKPVDCARLQSRLKACLPEVVSQYAPGLKKLLPKKRAQLLERIDGHLKTEVVNHCSYDAAAFRKKHGTKPTKTKSYGEDKNQKQLSACLQEQACRTFASCLLGVARLKGPKRANPKDPRVFPIAPPRPVLAPSSDAGVAPTGADAMKATDAMKAPDKGMKTVKIAPKGGKVRPRKPDMITRSSPKPRPGRPIRPPSRPMPRPRPR